MGKLRFSPGLVLWIALPVTRRICPVAHNHAFARKGKCLNVEKIIAQKLINHENDVEVMSSSDFTGYLEASVECI